MIMVSRFALSTMPEYSINVRKMQQSNTMDMLLFSPHHTLVDSSSAAITLSGIIAQACSHEPHLKQPKDCLIDYYQQLKNAATDNYPEISQHNCWCSTVKQVTLSLFGQPSSLLHFCRDVIVISQDVNNKPCIAKHRPWANNNKLIRD